VISISKILVHFGKENSTRLDKLIAFMKLGDKLIPKKRVISRFPDTRYFLDARDTAALLGKYA
jgi:hypothetical protein